MKKLIIGTLTGGIFNFFLGWLVYGMLFREMGKSLAGEGMAAVTLPDDQMRMMYIIVSNLAWGFLISWIMLRSAAITTATGAITGAIFGAVATLWVDSSLFSMTSLYTLPGIGLDMMLGAATGAATGLVVSLVLNRVRS